MGLFTLVFFGLPESVFAVTYYVEPDTDTDSSEPYSSVWYKVGSIPSSGDNDGNNTTIDSVLLSASDSDTIMIKGGVTYNDDINFNEAKDLVIEAYDGIVTLDDGSSQVLGFGASADGRTYSITGVKFVSTALIVARSDYDVNFTCTDCQFWNGGGLQFKGESGGGNVHFVRSLFKNLTGENYGFALNIGLISDVDIVFDYPVFENISARGIRHTYGVMRVNNPIFYGINKSWLSSFGGVGDEVYLNNFYGVGVIDLATEILESNNNSLGIFNLKNGVLPVHSVKDELYQVDGEFDSIESVFGINSSGDTTDQYVNPGITQNRSTAIVSFFWDDSPALSDLYGSNGSDGLAAVLESFGWRATIGLDLTEDLSDEQWNQVQWLYERGHGITGHTRHEVNLGDHRAGLIQYTGSQATSSLYINSSTGKIYTDTDEDGLYNGATDEFEFDITSSEYNPTGKFGTKTLFDDINILSNYTAISGNDNPINYCGNGHAETLADLSNQDIKTSQYTVYYDVEKNLTKK